MSRHLTFRFSIGLATCTALGGFGCADPADSMGGSQRAGGGRQLRLANVSVDRAFEAGTYAMQQWFRGVDPRPSGGLIRGLATEYTQSGGTERIRDVIGFPNRMRRRGTLSIQALGDGCRLFCRVDRERLDTSDHRIFRQQPESRHILGGITRELLKELMESARIDCRDEPVTEAELRAAREIWVSSSTKEVTPVVRLDGKPVGEGAPGPLWERIHGLFQDYKQRLMRGDAD